jgi:hypothetical protein
MQPAVLQFQSRRRRYVLGERALAILRRCRMTVLHHPRESRPRPAGARLQAAWSPERDHNRTTLRKMGEGAAGPARQSRNRDVGKEEAQT